MTHLRQKRWLTQTRLEDRHVFANRVIPARFWGTPDFYVFREVCRLLSQDSVKKCYCQRGDESSGLLSLGGGDGAARQISIVGYLMEDMTGMLGVRFT